MDEKELRKTLEIQLDTLRRNLEVVSLDVLKTKYKKPYDELREKICKAATAYTRHVALSNIRIRHSLFDEAKTYIDAAIQQMCFALNHLNRSALDTTNTELKLMAKAPIIGFNFNPKDK